MLAQVITHCQFAISRHYFIILLILKLFFAKWVVTSNLSALRFMLVDFRKHEKFITKLAFNLKAMDNFFDNTRCSSNFDVFVANRTITI